MVFAIGVWGDFALRGLMKPRERGRPVGLMPNHVKAGRERLFFERRSVDA